MKPLLAVALVAIAAALVLLGRRTPVEVRVHNASTLDFADVRVAGQAFGPVSPGDTSDYRPVALRFRYAALELALGDRAVTGQTLNIGARRFTYRIEVLDAAAGRLAIDVIREGA